MERDALKKLEEWKSSSSRKPLVIRGARQVGKTWLMKEFGRRQYEQTVYVNFEKSKRLHTLFEGDLDVKRILTGLQVESGVTIRPENTLIIFDEIQEVPQAITALKYFNEDAPEYHILVAGSLMGMAVHAGISFPVGKVMFMELYPMTYREFLLAAGERELIHLLREEDWGLIRAFKEKFIERLRQYYFVGGMPEAVQTFVEDRNFREVREIQRGILDTYELDFSKHAPVRLLPRIRMAWNAIPAQLAKENRKFIYGLIKKGARAKDYELAISWMEDCGQVHKVNRISKPAIPLKAYEDAYAFKLFLVDVGLLGAMGDLDAGTLLEGNAVFSEFKGALTEQYVFQQLISQRSFVIKYWSSERATAEVDFVLQYGGSIIPIEVKAEENLKAKSLKIYKEKFHPPLALRFSMSDYREQEWLVNVPLYGIGNVEELLQRVKRS